MPHNKHKVRTSSKYFQFIEAHTFSKSNLNAKSLFFIFSVLINANCSELMILVATSYRILYRVYVLDEHSFFGERSVSIAKSIRILVARWWDLITRLSVRWELGRAKLSFI